MKRSFILALAVALIGAGLVSCKKETPAEQTKKEGLNLMQKAEKVVEKGAEDAEDAAKKGAEEAKKAIDEITK